jgi:membrane-bound ClpP family serine protease
MRAKVERSGGKEDDGAMIMKTLLITGAIALVVGFSGTLLTLFGPNTLEAQYVKFAIMLLLFLVMLVGSYWFVMVPSERTGRRENPSGRDAEGGTPPPPREP